MYVRSQNSLLQYDLMGWSYPCKASILVWPATKADTMCWSSLHLVIDVRGSTPFSRLSTIYIHRPFMSTSCLLIESLIRVTSKEPELSAYWHNLNAFSTHQLPSTTINLHLPGCGNKIDANLFLSLAVAPLPFTKRNGTRWRRSGSSEAHLGRPAVKKRIPRRRFETSKAISCRTGWKKEWPMGHHAKSRPNLLRQTSTTMESEQKNIFMDSWIHGHVDTASRLSRSASRWAPLRSPHSPFFLLQKSGRSRLFSAFKRQNCDRCRSASSIQSSSSSKVALTWSVEVSCQPSEVTQLHNSFLQTLGLSRHS